MSDEQESEVRSQNEDGGSQLSPPIKSGVSAGDSPPEAR
jgi:hypothetical protein